MLRARQAAFAPEQIRELQDLSREPDPQLCYEALLNLAQRLQRDNHFESAAAIFSTVAESIGRSQAADPQGSAAEGSEVMLRRARQGLALLGGQGESLARVEVLGRRFVEQATDPRMILSFGLAGGLASVVRQSVLASLSLRTASLLSRGLGARFLASSAATFTEIPAFVAVNRGLREFSAEGSPPGTEGLRDELLSTALFLTTLRITGALSEMGIAHLVRSPALSQGLAAGASLGGVYLALRLQEATGHRRAQGSLDRWVDAADTLLQMRVGGRLWQSIAGSPSPHRLPAEAPLSSPRASLGAPELRPLSASRDGTELREVPGSQEALQRLRLGITTRLGTTSHLQLLQIGQGIGQLHPFVDLILRTGISDSFKLSGSIQRLHHAVANSDPSGTQGSYSGWITRLALEEIVQNGDPDSLTGLLSHLAEGGNLYHYEHRLGALFPSLQFFQVTGLANRLRSENHDRIRNLPLSPSARDALYNFRQIQGEDINPELSKVENWLSRHPQAAEHLDQALALAGTSPMGYYRVYRLLQIIHLEPANRQKILELADPAVFLHPLQSAATLTPGRPLSLVSQGDAYLGDAVFLDYLKEFQGELPELWDDIRAHQRYLRSESLLRRLWQGRSLQLTTPLLLQAFAEFGDGGDGISRDIAAALREGRVELDIRPPEDFVREAQRIHPGERGEFLNAFFRAADGEHPVDRIFLKQITGVSPLVFYRMAFRSLARVVHEYEHHLRHPAEPRVLDSLFPEEMIATLRPIHWRARHGDIENLTTELTSHPLGLAMYLRDQIDRYYLLRNPPP
ncbi:MAG: hypothetical protein U1F66_03415 [bacterium]